MMIPGVTDRRRRSANRSSWEVKMIIDQCRKPLRAPARVVFPDALDVRVLKAAHYRAAAGPGASDPRRQPLRAAGSSPLANVCR